jgi:hypothetical protein
VRYQAGSHFGSGFKPRPKSDASIREIPLAPQVVEAICRRLPPGSDPAALLFTGPGSVSIDALTGFGLTDTGLLALFLLGIAGGLLGVSAPRLLAREAEATDGRGRDG